MTPTLEMVDGVLCYGGTPIAELGDDAILQAIEREGVDTSGAETLQEALQKHYDDVLATQGQQPLKGDALRVAVLAEAEEVKALDKYNVPELRELCAKAGVSAEGKKDALIAALRGEELDDQEPEAKEPEAKEPEAKEPKIIGYTIASPIKENGKMLKVGSLYKGKPAEGLVAAGCLEPIYEDAE